MNDPCEYLHEIAALVLDCTDNADCTALYKHMEQCPQCFVVYVEYFQVVAVLTDDCPCHEPPASLKNKVCPKNNLN
jgi:hypothetical protein